MCDKIKNGSPERGKMHAGKIDIWTESSYMNVFRDYKKTVESNSYLEFVMVKNEFESAQILLRSSSEFTINSIHFSDLISEDGVIQAGNLKYNYVEYSLLTNCTEGQDESTVVRYAPPATYFPDALSNGRSVAVDPDSTQPIWITVFVPKDAKAGIYTGTAVVCTTEGEYEVKISVEVNNAVLPDSKDGEFEFAFWMQTAGTWDWDDEHDVYKVTYGHTRYSKKWWELMENVAVNMREHRHNVLLVNYVSMLLDGGTEIDPAGRFIFKWDRFDQVIQFFIDRRAVKRLEGPAFLSRVAEIDYKGFIIKRNKDGKMIKAIADWEDTETQNFYDQLLPALKEHLEEKGWCNIWFQHIGDEPHAERQEKVWGEMYEKFRKFCPGIKCGDPIDNCEIVDFLENRVDMLFPVESIYETNTEFFDRHKAAGKEVWMYTCMQPKGAWLNRFVDKPVWHMRSIGWLSYKRGVPRHLHWGWNEWCKPGVNRLMTIDEDNYKGDCYTVYPDPENNLIKGSIRYDAVRDAIEDFEIFRLAEKVDPVKAMEIANSIVASGIEYSKDIGLMTGKRKELVRLAGTLMFIETEK